jgi:dipeptidase E
MRLLLISSSNVHGYGYLDWAEPHILDFVGDRKRVVFVPFAAKDHAAYIKLFRERVERMGLDVEPLEERLDRTDVLFVGGGNTFRLLSALYERNLLDRIRERVRSGAMLYIGSSAGTNITAPTIKTTNDMPILYPPSFDALGLVPFQINPHYLDPDPDSTHKGETREQRIREFLEENETPVIGLREGSALRVEHDRATLIGEKTARWFERGKEPVELPAGHTIPI